MDTSTSNSAPTSPPEPRLVTSIWLALLPVIPLLSVLAYPALRSSPRLPRSVAVVLGVYVATQLLAALFTPHPLLSLVLAAARSLLLVALLTIGYHLGRTEHLRPLLIGLGVIYVTAFVSSFMQFGPGFLTQRLVHPYSYATALGMFGTLGVWMAVTARGDSLWWRVPFTTLAGSVLLLSGSRGPLLALIVGLLAASLVKARFAAVTLGLTGIVLVGLFVVRPDAANLERLADTGATNRDLYWQDTLSVVRAHPFAGVGPYQLGAYLTPQQPECQLQAFLERTGRSCAPWFASLSDIFVVSHNIVLQHLGESGFIGLAGAFLVFGLIASAVWRSRQPLPSALFFGLFVIGAVDFVTFPSVGFMEILFLAGGVALAHRPQNTSNDIPAWSAVILFVTALPLVALTPLARTPTKRTTLIELDAPAHWEKSEPYPVRASLTFPQGQYRLALRVCHQTCVTANILNIEGSAWEGWINAPLRQPAPMRLQLQLLPREPSVLAFQPYASREWSVSP